MMGNVIFIYFAELGSNNNEDKRKEDNDEVAEVETKFGLFLRQSVNLQKNLHAHEISTTFIKIILSICDL